MKKFDFGQLVTVMANLGVIAGIVVLAYELRQNNDLLNIELHTARFERQVSAIDAILNNSETDLLGLLAESVDDMSSEDFNTLVLLGIRALISFEQVFEEVQAGLLEEDSVIRTLRAIYQRPTLNYGAPLAWETYRERATPEFVDWMEENIVIAE